MDVVKIISINVFNGKAPIKTTYGYTVYPKEMEAGTGTDARTPMFTAAVFT